MRRLKLLPGAVAAALVGVSGVAHAAHVGVFIGGGVPYYYPVAPVPYYYGPPPVIVAPPPPQAPDYIEQGQPQSGAPDAGPQGPGNAPPGDIAGGQQENSDTWYYCDESKTYYPYAQQCASGWRAVPAQPAPSN
ncbi:hypothetical protein [Paraburkholderia lycopersici]|uniref:Lipoprotein n=1 Tax=Paraburkholderia lycopersici TaxID=416944 RepID=A0A1G6JD18_9BURK|nr:hypothetical protein [Paraburkholderia lycopersici]SDC16527.1 hypothetical protein SAMN05421548_104216 [Paraburkholderia lycopersici]